MLSVKLMGPLLALGMLFSASYSWASGLSDVEILDKGAEMRTLVASAAKHYLHAAAGIEVEESRQAVLAASERFEKNLHLLKLNAPNSYARNGLKQLDSAWQAYQTMLQQQPTQTLVEDLVEATNKLIFLSDALLNNWGGLPSNRDLEALNLAHMQAMLSERMGLLYAAHYYGLKDDWVVMELNSTLHEYDRSLKFLQRFLANESPVEDYMAQVNNQWDYAKQGFAKFNQGHYLPKVIAVTMDSMQSEMAQVATYYSDHYQGNDNALVTLSVPGLAANME